MRNHHGFTKDSHMMLACGRKVRGLYLFCGVNVLYISVPDLSPHGCALHRIALLDSWDTGEGQLDHLFDLSTRNRKYYFEKGIGWLDLAGVILWVESTQKVGDMKQTRRRITWHDADRDNGCWQLTSGAGVYLKGGLADPQIVILRRDSTPAQVVLVGKSTSQQRNNFGFQRVRSQEPCLPLFYNEVFNVHRDQKVRV